MNMNRFATGVSAIALAAAAPGLALAQSAPAEPPAAAVEEIVVTGSRIQGGMQTPTPVTVVGTQELQKSMQTTVANYLNQLPSFGAPTSSANPGPGVAGAGLSLLNLRSLSSARTLVLLDNRRVVNSTTGGGVDTNTLPMTLVKRVEVVTGGASAAWGADAIAGVVNFVLDHDYRGLEVAVQGSTTTYRDNTNEKIDVTFGRSLFGGRGSIVGAATFSNSPEIVRTGDRSWWERWAVVNNPTYTATNGQAKQTWAKTSLVSSSPGGVIVAGPLKGTQFLGPNGTPAPYDFGFTSTTLQVGGTRTLDTAVARNLTNALTYGNVFLHGRYDITDNVTAYAEMSYGKSRVKSDSIYYNRASNIVARVDNPYLPESVRQALVAAGQTTFTMSRLNTEAGPPGGINDREMLRGVIGLEGKVGDWKWGTYYQRGQVDVRSTTFANGLVPRYNDAIDAVRNPAGQIVCRSSLANPGNGCIPFNIFGVGAATPAAVNYIFGTTPFQDITLKQQFVSAEASGPIWQLPAGALTLAIGADASKDQATSTQDADSLAKNYVTGNPQPFNGQVTFKELFGEVNVPLLKDLPLIKQLDLNAAGRMTHYSTSGTVYTWKVGVSDSVTDELRLRVTRSRDIRAPSLADLFTLGQAGTQTVFDPLTQLPYNVRANTRGNADLQPERADTWTAGVVYRPEWLPGLAASVDYYDIRIHGAITSLGSGQTVDLCFGARPELCDRLIRGANNALLEVELIPTNINVLRTNGIDAEVVYRRPMFDGNVTFRALGSYQPRLDETDVQGVTTKSGGSIAGLTEGQPDFKGNFSVGYDRGPYSVQATFRYIGGAKLRNEWVEGIDIDDNHVGATGYIDLNGGYDFDVHGHATKLSFAVDNVLNTPPKIVPATPSTVPYGASSPSTRLDLYDALGRTYRIGLRAKF
jgi:iron complex outermembrane receptor protein